MANKSLFKYRAILKIVKKSQVNNQSNMAVDSYYDKLVFLFN